MKGWKKFTPSEIDEIQHLYMVQIPAAEIASKFGHTKQAILSLISRKDIAGHVICLNCDRPFTKQASTQKYCSPECQHSANRKHRSITFTDWMTMREFILERDNYICQKCGSNVEPLHVHHKISIHRQGQSIPENLVTLCQSCHYSIHFISRRAAVNQPIVLTTSYPSRLETTPCALGTG